MNDRPEDEDDDIENEDDATGDSQLSGDDEDEVVIPSWQMPGMEAYLRSVVDPILKQVGAFDRIAKIASH